MPPIPDATNVDASDNSADSRVTFNTEVDVEEAAPVESFSRKTSQELRAAKHRQSLSASAKAWDIDGDGTLDDTELALKALDKSAKGTLNKDQMYHLMQQNLGVQKELGKVKKVVIGLVVFTCLLALANVGVSFAAAFLAKDTTSSEGKLVDSKTGDALATDSTTTLFEASPQLTRRHRALCETTAGNGNKLASAVCSGSAGVLELAHGKDLVQACNDGGSATLVLDGTHHHPCPVVGTATDTYSGNGGSSHRGITINYADGSSQSVQPVNDAGEVKTDGSATKYVATGFSSPVLANGDACDPANDMCDANLACYENQIGEGTCACANDDACGGDVCSTPCNMADATPQCYSQDSLNSESMCLDINGPSTPHCEAGFSYRECTEAPSGGASSALAMGAACDPENDLCDTNLTCYGSQLPGEGTCGCAHSDACGGDVCSIPCNMADVTPQCYSQDSLNLESMCLDYDPATPHCEAGFSYRQCTAAPR